MLKIGSSLLFSFLFYVQLSAQSFDYSENCKQAYHAIYKLKINEGMQWLAKEKKEHPKNFLPIFLENHADFLKLNINDNRALYDNTKSRVEYRLERLKDGDKNSPFYLYTLAEIHLQWAFCKIKFGEYVSAVFEVRKAYQMLLDNKKKFPDFKPNTKSLGLLHTLFGAVPDKYKFGAKLLGLKGSIEQGLAELNSVMQDDDFQFRDETILMYTLLMLHLQKDETTSWNMIQSAEIPLNDNLLNYFVAATVANHTGKNDKMIEILTDRPVGSAYYPFPYLDFMLGFAKLNRLDSNADVYIKKFITQNKGRSYQKEAYRKLAWYYLVNGQPALYRKYMQQILLIADAPTDEDKSAQKEALQNIIPQQELLKARLLFDGAYYEKALTVLDDISFDKLSNSRDKIEYFYRKARIYDELNKSNDAIKFYLLTIEKGADFKYYFAANACLKVATIFERLLKQNMAIKYYKKAIDLDKDEYANSIDAEAKAGLNRLGE